MCSHAHEPIDIEVRPSQAGGKNIDIVCVWLSILSLFVHLEVYMYTAASVGTRKLTCDGVDAATVRKASNHPCQNSGGKQGKCWCSFGDRVGVTWRATCAEPDPLLA